MNKRIKELAQQAGLMFDCNYGELNPKFQEFAELIIRECCEVVQPKPHDIGDTAGMYLAQKKIKANFGVE